MSHLGKDPRLTRVNLTDQDAQLMKGRQGIMPGYNAQAMASPVAQSSGGGMLITAADVVDSAADSGALWIGPYDALLRKHRQWMTTERARGLYAQRKELIEPIFGILKEQLSARRFLLRGLANVRAEFVLLATAFNLRTLWRIWITRWRPPAMEAPST